jgi:hypothetical protein
MAGAAFASIIVVSDYVTYVVRRGRMFWRLSLWLRPQCWPSEMQDATRLLAVIRIVGNQQIPKNAPQSRRTQPAAIIALRRRN